jgi:hypothetical protein
MYKLRPIYKERIFLKYSFVISKHNEDAYGEYSATEGDDKEFNVIIMKINRYEYLEEADVA